MTVVRINGGRAIFWRGSTGWWCDIRRRVRHTKWTVIPAGDHGVVKLERPLAVSNGIGMTGFFHSGSLREARQYAARLLRARS